MTNTRRFTYPSDKEISDIVVDDTNNYVWMAFKQNSSGNCILERQSPYKPNLTYYSIDIAVDEIKKLLIEGIYIYTAVDDTSLIGGRYKLSSPITNQTDFSLPAGVTEAPVDLVSDGTYIYFLIPGNDSGEVASLVKFNLAGTYQETITLQDSVDSVRNARSMTIDDSDNIWIVTYTSPAELVRVWNDGVWNFDITEIT